jgi:hypothetical protein
MQIIAIGPETPVPPPPPPPAKPGSDERAPTKPVNDPEGESSPPEPDTVPRQEPAKRVDGARTPAGHRIGRRPTPPAGQMITIKNGRRGTRVVS